MLVLGTKIKQLPKKSTKKRMDCYYGMCIESKFVKYMIKGIWLQMKFCEILWGEIKIVKIGAWKRRGQCKQFDFVEIFYFGSSLKLNCFVFNAAIDINVCF